MKKLYLNWKDSYTLRQFVDQMTKCEINGEKQIKIVAPVGMRTYPDICVPLTVLIDGYRDKGFEFVFDFHGDNNYVKHTSISNPLQVEEMFESPELRFPLDKVWKYNSAEGVGKLVTEYIQAIRSNDVLEKGVISSVEWCLNEVMDNVLQHSKSGIGYVMGQMHRGKKELTCVWQIVEWEYMEV